LNYNYKIKEIIANKELFGWIAQAMQLGKEKFLLKYAPKLGSISGFIVEQINVQNKLSVKLPSWQKYKCLYTLRSFEQSTAEKVAEYKSGLLLGKNLLVLGGGLGVDEWAFSTKFETIESIDNDEELNELAKYNFGIHEQENINRVTDTAEHFLSTDKKKYSAIYIDPDRRDDEKRQILLAEHQPNVLALMTFLLEKTENIWIKSSPLYDMDMALKELQNIKSIYSISLYGEVKEMLIQIKKNYNESPQIICVDILKDTIKEQVFLNEGNLSLQKAESLEGYLYEAGSSIVKMRKHHAYATFNNLQLIDVNVPFYIGKIAIDGFIGKCFKIIDVLNFNTSQLKTYFKKEKITYINAKTRGIQFIETKDFYKKTGLKEGGELYAWICPFLGTNRVIICKKV